MNALAPISQTQAVGFSPSQIKLVKSTVAKDCNDTEFDLFMEFSRSMGLNPFRGQILPMVFSKNSPTKRRMTMIVTRDGLRVIASRCKNYRPASEAPTIVYDESLKGPSNPKGIVSASIRLWQQDNAGEWFPVLGEAYWDEFAPLTYPPSAYDEKDTGRTWPDGNPIMDKTLRADAVQILDMSGNWFKMPIVMIVKCAEAQALRAGWPEQFAGVYAEEEMDRAKLLDATATEIVAKADEERRIELVSGVGALLVCFNAQTAELENVPVPKFADRVLEWIRGCDREAVRSFMERNRQPLREFWSRAPGDALALKKELEKACA